MPYFYIKCPDTMDMIRKEDKCTNSKRVFLGNMPSPSKSESDRGREGFRLPSLRTVQAGLPHTALQSVVTPSGLTD